MAVEHAPGHHSTQSVRLLASNGEPVWPDGETSELVARPSPGRDWDTWELRRADARDDAPVHLVAPTGYAISQIGSGGELRVNRPLASDLEGFTVSHLERRDDDGHDHGAHPNESGLGDTFAPAVTLRAPSGRYVGLEPATDRLVARAERPTSAEVFVIEEVEGPEAAEAVVGKCVVTPSPLAVTGVHAAVLPTGNVLFFSYLSRTYENSVTICKSQLWNPDTGPVPDSLQEVATNLFCSAHCWLGDGRLLVAAGQSNNFPLPGAPAPTVLGADHHVHTFDPRTSKWTRHPNMPAARYYPTCATLADGRGFIASGAAVRGIGGNVPNDDYEVFDPESGRCGPKRRFRPQKTNFLEHGEYPFLQLLYDGTPAGRLFVMSWNKARLFDLNSRTFRAEEFTTPRAGGRTYPRQGAAVLLPQSVTSPQKARILVVGGEHNDELVTDAAEIFEYDGEKPANCRWRPAKGPVTLHRRFMSDAVLLPDETVLVVNGASRGKADDSHDPVYEAEVFDTRTESWSRGAKINRARMYHSSACLLPDGRVAIAGNTYTFNPGNPREDRTVELYSPAYLFRGSRPQISMAPQIVAHGQDFWVQTPNAASVDRVCLLRAGSVTHTNNMDQRHLLLPFERRGTDMLLVTAPGHGTVAPPGPWMLFLLSNDRVPSVGRFLQVREPVRDAAYVSLIVPDHVKAGERFVATLTMRNTGTLTWGVGYKLGSQSPQDNEIWGVSRIEISTVIAPGEVAPVKFAVTAPAAQGTYPFQWRMLEERVQWFGASTPPVRISVSGATEDPACDGIRAQLEAINEQVTNLSDRLNGNEKHDAPILRAIDNLMNKARELTRRGQALGCALSIAPHH